MATAGHCSGVLPGNEESWPNGKGPIVRQLPGGRIGRFAYVINGSVDESPEIDFGLIRLDPGVEASPKLCHWGGPTGLNDDLVPTSTMLELRFYGQGLGVGEVTPARSAWAQGAPDRYELAALGPAISGDSGSPVISADGRAVGIFYAYGGVWSPRTSQVGTMFVSRLAPAVDRGEHALGIELALETAPLSNR